MAALAQMSALRTAPASSRVTCPAPRLAARSTFGRKGLSVSNGTKVSAWFKFGKNGANAEDAGIIGGQMREDYDKVDVEQYFNYMGILADEGSYDSMDTMMSTGMHPADIILNWASMEGDLPKIEELLKAGADPKATNLKGEDAWAVAGRSVASKKNEVLGLLESVKAK